MSEWSVDAVPNGVVIEGRIIPAQQVNIENDCAEIIMPLENKLTALLSVPLTPKGRTNSGMDGMEAKATLLLFWGDWEADDIATGGPVFVDSSTDSAICQTNASAHIEMCDIYEASEIFTVLAKWGSFAPIDSPGLVAEKAKDAYWKEISETG